MTDHIASVCVCVGDKKKWNNYQNVTKGRFGESKRIKERKIYVHDCPRDEETQKGLWHLVKLLIEGGRRRMEREMVVN